MGICVKHEQCPRCAENGNDSKGNNLAVYEDDSCYCFACGYTRLSDAEKEARGLNSFDWFADGGMEDLMAKREKLTTEEVEKIKLQTGERGNLSRGISDEVYKQYRVRFGYDEQTGEVNSHYYPYTEDNKASGYKLRKLPKEFSVIGKVGSESDLFGQAFFRNSAGKFIVLCAGEVDTLSAYSMLNANRDTKYDPIPCVSAGTGENGSHKQIAKHYSWFDRFEKIIVCYDMDNTGREAVKSLVSVLPKNKMFVMTLPMKDCNEMLVSGKEQSFINAFWQAKPYTPEGIAGSASFMDAVMKEAYAPRIEFPPFMAKFNDMTAGGPALGTIGLISAFTGAAKSTIVNECCYHWLFNIDLKIGVISMEQNLGQYSELVLSRHLNIKLNAMRQEDKIALLKEGWVQEKANELFKDSNGADRWYVIDDRDCPISVMKKRIEQLIVQCGCQVIVWDTISDSFDMLTIDEQAQTMMWMKGMVTQYPVSFILIAHQRKVGSGEKDGSQGGIGTESGVQGSSTLVKSAAWVVIASRDKMNEDEVIRNTTNLFMPKNRGAGTTGECGKLYYDNKTHTLYDFDNWAANNGVNF